MLHAYCNCLVVARVVFHCSVRVLVVFCSKLRPSLSLTLFCEDFLLCCVSVAIALVLAVGEWPCTWLCLCAWFVMLETGGSGES